MSGWWVWGRFPMRLRKRHAWSAVLVVLFALPVARPQGFPGLEGWLDSTLNWYARTDVGNPHAWGGTRAPSSDESPRERDLEALSLRLREDYLAAVDEARQRLELRDAIGALPRLPRSLPARVLRAHDTSSLRRSILIDRGTEDGVREGLAVVDGGVLVGLVAMAEAHASRVQLVTDPRSRLEVAVRTQEGERAVGFLIGGLTDSLNVRHLRGRAGLVVRAGDPALSSNADPRVPAGLVVGRVASANGGDPDSFLDVSVRPQFDVDRTLSVLVLLPAE